MITLGAFLPGLTAAVVDRQQDIGYADIAPIELELQEKDSLTMLEKVYLSRSSSDALDISSTSMQMTEDMVKDAVRTGLEPYREADLLRGWTEDTLFQCRPILMIDEATGLYGQAWVVFLSRGVTHTAQLNLLVDDETGRLLDIYSWSFDWLYASRDMSECLETFMALYLQGLELEEPYYIRDTTTSSEGVSLQCRWQFPLDNDSAVDFDIEFCFFPQGFYTN